MATVRIGTQFFRKEALSYSSPATGFWRELIQNSVDNRARRIDVLIEAVKSSRELVRVRFSDNGTGMDRATLEDVFFCLGETTKSDTSTIGGFGRARLLTCFAQESYSIRTQNLEVIGAGADYEISQVDRFFKGCEFDIVVHLPTMRALPYNDYEEPETRIRQALLNYLSKCQFSSALEVVINGERYTNYLMKRQKRGDLSFGSIHVVQNPQSHSSYMHVRVSGVLMFEKYLYGTDACVIVEIDPQRSRQVLLSNRDGLQREYVNELDTLVQRLAVDNLSALDKRRSETIVAEGGYRWASTRKLPMKQSRKKATPLAVSDRASAFQPPLMGEALTSAQTYVMEVGEEVIGRVDFSSYLAAKQPDELTQGMYFVLDTDNVKLRAAARKWQARYLTTEGPGRNRRKLFAQWVIACEWAISAFSCIQDEYTIEMWAPGVYFKEEADAGYQAGQMEDSHVFLFKPLDNSGKVRYGINSLEDHADMLASAAHEVCHVAYEGHNEGFAMLLTNMMAKLAPHLTAIHQEMKKAG